MLPFDVYVLRPSGKQKYLLADELLSQVERILLDDNNVETLEELEVACDECDETNILFMQSDDIIIEVIRLLASWPDNVIASKAKKIMSTYIAI